mmetsp:Transcript_7920/g.16539  ORF Transcript_7920/g.16539 Transcript_7920/m.16539 type:complete len:211 (-) Transcript_7920:25-657(-)
MALVSSFFLLRSSTSSLSCSLIFLTIASTMTLSLSASSLASTARTCRSRICFWRTVFCSIMADLLFSSLSISFLMWSCLSYSIWSSIADSRACSRDFSRSASWCWAALSLLTYAMFSFLSRSLSSSLVSHILWISLSILSCSAFLRLISLASLVFCSKISLFIFFSCSSCSTVRATMFSAATRAMTFWRRAWLTLSSFLAAWERRGLSPT